MPTLKWKTGLAINRPNFASWLWFDSPVFSNYTTFNSPANNLMICEGYIGRLTGHTIENSLVKTNREQEVFAHVGAVLSLRGLKCILSPSKVLQERPGEKVLRYGPASHFYTRRVCFRSRSNVKDSKITRCKILLRSKISSDQKWGDPEFSVTSSALDFVV